MGAAEVDIGRRDVFQALVISFVIVIRHKAFDLTLQVTRQEVIFQQDSVFQRLVPSLDFSLRLRMIRRAAHMAHVVVFDVVRKLARDVAGTIVRQKSWLMNDMRLVTARRFERHVQRLGNIRRFHRRAQFPADDVARDVVQDCRQIHPAPTDNLDVSEVGLPHLVYSRCFITELARGVHNDKGGTGDQVMGLQQAVD